MTPLTVFYDGLCPLCSREIDHYRRHDTQSAIVFVDIAAPEFEAGAYGLDPVAIHREMHAVRGTEILTGVRTFVALWDAIPRYRWLARVVQQPVIRTCARLGYAAFARVRPLLPRRSNPLCATDRCKR